MPNLDDELPPPPPPQWGTEAHSHPGAAPENHAAARAALVVPGTVLAVAAALGILICGFFTAAYAFMDPEDMKRRLAEQGQGAEMAELSQQLGMALFGVGCLLSVVSLAGAIAMIRARSWGLAMTGAIVAMVNVCCCVAGLPIGIWCLVILLRPESKSAFSHD